MKYYIIAGEASGDLHGSNLMKGIYAEDPQAEIRFWGGDCMQSVWAATEGSGLVRHYKEGAVMGFVEVLAKAGKLMKNVKFCQNDILQWNPDVVILIDYPGFNFKIAEAPCRREAAHPGSAGRRYVQSSRRRCRRRTWRSRRYDPGP